jgi:uncharacterized protein YndB with AHSA1/START domain
METTMYDLTEAALVAASPETVWHDWTDASALAEWIWPPRFETAVMIDAIPGGVWEVRSVPASMAVLGQVVSLERPVALRLAWRWDGDEHATDVDVSFEPAADGATRVVVVHSGFPTAAERDDHVQGWTDCLDRLVARHAAP